MAHTMPSMRKGNVPPKIRNLARGVEADRVWTPEAPTSPVRIENPNESVTNADLPEGWRITGIGIMGNTTQVRVSNRERY